MYDNNMVPSLILCLVTLDLTEANVAIFDIIRSFINNGNLLCLAVLIPTVNEFKGEKPRRDGRDEEERDADSKPRLFIQSKVEAATYGYNPDTMSNRAY